MAAEIIDLRTPSQLRSDEEIQAYIHRDTCIRQLITAWIGRFPYSEPPQETDLREKIFELAMDRLTLAQTEYNQAIAVQIRCDD
jgi:hypothetical protein